MKRFGSARLAGNILLIALGLLAVFHVLVLLGVVPADAIWGGQINGASANLLLLEIIALLVTGVFAVVVAVKLGYLKTGRFKRAADVGVWILFAYLVLNTIGNLASAASFEALIFAPITIALALCALRLAVEK